VPNAAQPQDSNSPQLEYGPSNYNIPHRMTWVFSYELPSRVGSLQRLKNGWGIESTASLQSGQPFEFAFNCEDDYSGGAECFDRPDVVAPISYHKRNPYDYIDLSSFAMPCDLAPGITESNLSGFASDCEPGTRHYGNLGRNALIGPTYKQWDLALYKNTSLSERVKLQLRAEFFNILNHPNFANPEMPAFIADPAGNLGPCGCGFQVVNGREVLGQPAFPSLNIPANPGYNITATGDVGIGNPFLGGGGPRGIQLAAKFSF